MMDMMFISTQASQSNGETKFRFRRDDEIQQAVYEAMVSRKGNYPIIIGSRGFIGVRPTPSEIVDQMLYTQFLYRKTSGIRIREEILTICEDMLHRERVF